MSEQTQRLAGLWEVAQSANWWLPHQRVCWVSERHNVLHRNDAGQLHRDGGPAIAYPDGWCIWSLNGVRVPQWLAETVGEQLDCKQVLGLENVEHRREGVRKIGAERLLFKIGAVTLDSEPPVYELVEMDLGLRRKARALKMANPSVPEVWHVEFVDPSCKTVQQALNFRNGLKPSQIDDTNGAEWLQQGDVILRPKGATKFKSRPCQLT